MKQRGFTLIELLVVMAVIGILAALLLPVMNRAKQKAWGLRCLVNERQLALAWKLYSEDDNDRLLHSYVCNPLGYREWLPNAWIGDRPDLTVRASPLWPYARSLDVWSCPANLYAVDDLMKGTRYYHSLAMNYYIGGVCDVFNGNIYEADGDTSFGRTYRRTTDLAVPGPSVLFLFTDDRVGIFSQAFMVSMSGWHDQPQNYFIGDDYPAFSHNRAASFTFADGHSEPHRWLDPRTTPKPSIIYPPGALSPYNPDVAWLQWHATRPLP